MVGTLLESIRIMAELERAVHAATVDRRAQRADNDACRVGCAGEAWGCE
jgi:hypothetical protein